MAITIERVSRRLRRHGTQVADHLRGAAIRLADRWPCRDHKHLLIGPESSGTTAVANLLYVGQDGLRFLDEGDEHWVWDTYQSVYEGRRRIYDSPRLQLFDTIKVPGFAVILPQFREAFPNTMVACMVRDPRDVIQSAINTWKVERAEDLARIPWSSETWLGLTSTDPVERLASRWRIYMSLAGQDPGVVFLRYEDFCADKVGAIERLARQVGLPFNGERVNRLADQQLSRPATRNYTPRGPGGWRNGILSSDQIACVEKICLQEMGKWGYEAECL